MPSGWWDACPTWTSRPSGTTTSAAAASLACRGSSPAPATRGRTASSCTSRPPRPRRCGSGSWPRGSATARRPSASAPGTRLRLEMKYALYGNDIDETTNPLEAGLGWVVKPAKGDFVGRAAIEARPRGGAPPPAGRLRDGRAGGGPPRLPHPRRGRGRRRGDLRAPTAPRSTSTSASATYRRRWPPWAPRSRSRSAAAARRRVS